MANRPRGVVDEKNRKSGFGDKVKQAQKHTVASRYMKQKVPFEWATFPDDSKTGMFIGFTAGVFALVPVALISALYQIPYLEPNGIFQ
jgi:hypothetical protein